MAPSFRFLPSEVAELEAVSNQLNNAAVPNHAVLQALTDRFNASPARTGADMAVHFSQNRRRRHPEAAKPPRYPTAASQVTQSGRQQMHSSAPPAQLQTASSGKDHRKADQVQFEAKSARDGAWYDIDAFISKRNFETGNPEVMVHFVGLRAEDDEWVDVRTCVRQRSLPCQATECACIVRGDLVLCFQFHYILYYFLKQEIVPLRKLCRRPETNYRLQILHAANARVNVWAPPDGNNVEFASQVPQNDRCKD
ncbi:hypothetical protein PR202_ga16936 [Eleusine coracana subsp. coracana]|uniref:SAWADEE domain-containing protein n=1 Tax=Eleusine coracana subsp. coracana TaxID=191504 RepID=A0AAV5CPK8_ELECO|nr:hypothetical protein PR202_ga16936 [Eleusine coracana subsp. coracana]